MVKMKVIPRWVLPVYIGCLVVCALGWELWFTYGWIDGDPVYLRRAEALNTAIPFHLNWILNSLADAGAICLIGLLILHVTLGPHHGYLRAWSWPAFGILLVWFIGQNIAVEMFLYHDQLATGKPLSWAPFAPTGPWFNPVLFDFNGRTISLQGQWPWLIMTPLFYGCLIQYLGHDGLYAKSKRSKPG
jgi:hypothetical protein